MRRVANERPLTRCRQAGGLGQTQRRTLADEEMPKLQPVHYCWSHRENDKQGASQPRLRHFRIRGGSAPDTGSILPAAAIATAHPSRQCHLLRQDVLPGQDCCRVCVQGNRPMRPTASHRAQGSWKNQRQGRRRRSSQRNQARHSTRAVKTDLAVQLR